jgi:hypothetical protein
LSSHFEARTMTFRGGHLLKIGLGRGVGHSADERTRLKQHACRRGLTRMAWMFTGRRRSRYPIAGSVDGCTHRASCPRRSR